MPHLLGDGDVSGEQGRGGGVVVGVVVGVGTDFGVAPKLSNLQTSPPSFGHVALPEGKQH